jgi:hypothetical protein
MTHQKRHTGKAEVIFLSIGNLGYRMWWVIGRKPHERTRNYFKEGLAGFGADLDTRKISPPPGFDPWTVQHLESCYADYTIVTAVLTGTRANYRKVTADNDAPTFYFRIY